MFFLSIFFVYLKIFKLMIKFDSLKKKKILKIVYNRKKSAVIPLEVYFSKRLDCL